MSDRRDLARQREAGEPDELNNPVPWPVAVLSLVLIAWGAWYYFQNVGYPAAAGDRRSAIIVDPNAAIDGRIVYAGNCAACHQANGQGLAGVFPPLAGSAWVLDNEERLVQILLHGIQGELEVAGMVYDGVMPAFPQLSDAELAAVLSYIRSDWGNAAAPIPIDAITAGRERFPDRAAPWGGGEELDAVFTEP